MKQIKATTYKGYSKVAGETTFADAIARIKTGECKSSIAKITRLLQEGKNEQADNVKRQLPFLTATANYQEMRQPWSIKNYQPIITIDLDHLEVSKIKEIRERIESDDSTVACFLSPRQQGLKVFVYLNTPEANALRRLALTREIIRYSELITFHLEMYEMCRVYIESLTGAEVETSVKDISRGFYLSYDPNAYLNLELLSKLERIQAHIAAPDKLEKTSKNRQPESTITNKMGIQVEPRVNP